MTLIALARSRQFEQQARERLGLAMNKPSSMKLVMAPRLQVVEIGKRQSIILDRSLRIRKRKRRALNGITREIHPFAEVPYFVTTDAKGLLNNNLYKTDELSYVLFNADLQTRWRGVSYFSRKNMAAGSGRDERIPGSLVGC